MAAHTVVFLPQEFALHHLRGDVLLPGLFWDTSDGVKGEAKENDRKSDRAKQKKSACGRF
jgi:hypothetical protein